MASDDFIGLDHSSNSDHQEEENHLHESNSVPDADTQETVRENGEMEEGEHVQDMDLESDPEQEQGCSVIEESVELVESVVMVEKLKEVEPEKATVSDTTASKFLIDESPVAGVKRARMTYVDQQACVHVVYNSLTRESKKKLMELMQQWSEWHAQFNSSSTVSSKEALEYGEETYFPALHVGSENTSTVSFWVDNQARNEDIKSIKLDDSVPLYDRGYTLGSTSLGGSDDSERIGTLEASRCFNCGSYSHSLRECPKPRNNAAINSARKQHVSKRNSAPGSRVQTRYYQKSQGKFDDLKAGVLGPETRECLGIGELDPPPWLHRMRELGYPPGYLDVVEDDDQPSGISIFADEETKEQEEFEDGELPEKGDPVPPEKRMTVEFPGINAPIPENADHRRWAAPPTSFRNRSSHHRSNRLSDHQRNDDPRSTEYGSGSGYRSSDPQRGHYTDRQRNDGPPPPPGTEYGPGSSYSSRYGSYDHSSSSLTASPNMGRSLSDRGWRSSTGYEGLPPVQSPHSPYPYPLGSEQIPSPSARVERWSHDNPFSPTSDLSSANKERQDHHYYHQHHHHHHGRHHRN